MKEMRATVVKENPGLKLTDYSKLLGAKWRELTDEQKADYIERARAQNA